jgi:putative methionine-R-sulfoxide reductase with GAF domain
VSEANIEQIVAGGSDADDVLRDVVAALQQRYAWVGISFVEEGELVLGPSQGERTGDPVTIPISYENNVVAELGVTAAELNDEDRAWLDRVAELIAPYCLVGWDTGGQEWSP